MTEKNDSPAVPADPHGGHDLGFALPDPAPMSKTRLLAIGLAGAAVVAGAFFVGYLPRRAARAALESKTSADETANLRVEVVTPKTMASDHDIVLPGSIQPLEETIVYSRANGYVRRWLVDIGDVVKDGQLLAEIETPEIDQELSQARAQLAQAEAGVTLAKANREYSKASLVRYKALSPGVASQQEIDQRQAQASVDEASVTVAQANVGAQQANIRRLSQLKSFANVTAPFAGKVTMRSIEKGALVTPGTATPMFKISAADPVRVYVQVPQDVAPAVHPDVPAKVSIREYPGRVYQGKVARSAGALDSASRTMTTEVRVPNPSGELFGGMYAEVAITLPSPHRVFEIPATALRNDARGLRIAIVDEAGKLHLVPVIIERDTGATVLIASGLTGNERVVKIADADLSEGRSVDVVH